jgi:hypothetical protein
VDFTQFCRTPNRLQLLQAAAIRCNWLQLAATGCNWRNWLQVLQLAATAVTGCKCCNWLQLL